MGMPEYHDTNDKRCYNCKRKDHLVNDCDETVNPTAITHNAIKAFKKELDKNEVIEGLSTKLMEQAVHNDFSYSCLQSNGSILLILLGT